MGHDCDQVEAGMETAMGHGHKRGTGKTGSATERVKRVGTMEQEMDLCRKLDTETMVLEIRHAYVVDTEMAEWVILRANAADIESEEWGMQRGMGHRLAVVAAQEKLLVRSGVAEGEVLERRHDAFGSVAVLAVRENGRVCVSHGVRGALGILLGLLVSSW